MTEPAPTSALQTWAQIAQTPEVVSYFSGLFRRAGVRVAETGEEFTVSHTGSAFELNPGITPPVDFIVPLRMENVQNLVAHTQDGQIDPLESWRIVQVLFTPMTEATLRTPIFTHEALLLLAGVEAVTHVYLLSPSGEEAAQHTLSFAAGSWQILPGLHGQAKRIYRLTPDQAINYQRRVFAAIQQDSALGWWQFALWYRAWRQQVSVAV
jgi:hypothetical protein